MGSGFNGSNYSLQEIKDYINGVVAKNGTDYAKNAKELYAQMQKDNLTPDIIDKAMGYTDGFSDKGFRNYIPEYAMKLSNTTPTTTTPAIDYSRASAYGFTDVNKDTGMGTWTNPTTGEKYNVNMGELAKNVNISGTKPVGPNVTPDTKPDTSMLDMSSSTTSTAPTAPAIGGGSPFNTAFNDLRLERMQTRMPQYDAVFNPMPTSSAKGGGSSAKGGGATPSAEVRPVAEYARPMTPQSSSMKGA